MPVSIIPDPNDPYFIPSVPMYRDFRKEIDLNDSICDRFFEEQQSPKAEQPVEQPVPKVQAKQRPVSRRSLSQVPEQTPTIVQPTMRFGNTSRRSVITKGTSSEGMTVSSGPVTRSTFSSAKAPDVSHAVRSTVPEVQAKQRPVSRRSLSQVREQTPTIVQPPMRTSRRSVFTKGISSEGMPVSNGPVTCSIVSASKAPDASHAVRSTVPEVQAKQRPVSRRSLSQVREQTATIVQPPMRFGNTSRRTVISKGTTNEGMTVSSGPVTRSTVSAAKASGVSHAVRGICVVRNMPTNNKKQQTKDKHVEMQKRVKDCSPIADEGLVVAKKKNNSRSALEALETSNTSGPSGEMQGDGTPKKNERRFMVCHEILDTEQNYLAILNVIIDTFKKPLKAMMESEGERDLLNANELNTLFRKIEPLIHVHENILQKLRKQISDWGNTNLVGKIWAESAPDLEKYYPPYINSYDEMLAVLENCMATRPKFIVFLKNAEAKKECQKNSIKDLLIRPVQRIPSVLLLLQELQKRTERGNPDHPWVKGAVDRLRAVLNKTNESRRRTENYQHFMEVCQDIEGLPAHVITSDREFVQSIDVVVLNAGGTLQKYKGKTIGLFLFNDFVEVAKCRIYSSDLSRSSNNLNSSFTGNSSSGSSGGTLPRQLSLSTLRRGASWKKDRHRYKHIELYRFANFRSLEMEREQGVFILRIRDQKADEMCFFCPTNGYTFDIAFDFFENLIQRIKTTSTRDIVMEEITEQQIREQRENRPEEVDGILKALSIAAEFSSTGTIHRRRSQLRRSVSQLHLRISRIPSFKRSTILGNINE
ncbi:hypothetical protein niasHT_021489 [Heterodera trifolii]|uniref:DH domain-containing protein n=1 Tax=Heterodera trifolii TaxID=157864 RepID=A0ABD2KEP0_9BILA